MSEVALGALDRLLHANGDSEAEWKYLELSAYGADAAQVKSNVGLGDALWTHTA